MSCNIQVIGSIYFIIWNYKHLERKCLGKYLDLQGMKYVGCLGWCVTMNIIIYASCRIFLTHSLLAVKRLCKSARVFNECLFCPVFCRKLLCEKFHSWTGSDLVYRMSVFAAEPISFVLSQCMLHVYTDRV